jgi:hypothetical protein
VREKNRNSDKSQKKLEAIKQSPTLLSKQKLQMESAMQHECNAMSCLLLLRVSCVLRSTGWVDEDETVVTDSELLVH